MTKLSGWLRYCLYRITNIFNRGVDDSQTNLLKNALDVNAQNLTNFATYVYKVSISPNPGLMRELSQTFFT